MTNQSGSGFLQKELNPEETLVAGDSQVRLLLIINTLQCGGAERVVSILANHWAARGNQMTILTLASAGGSPFYTLHPSVTVRHLQEGSRVGSRVSRGLRILRRLRPEIRRSCPDAIISFMEPTNSITLLATRGLGVPVIVTVRTDPCRHPSTLLGAWIRDRTYPRADRIVVQTETVRRYFSDRLGLQTTLIPNPVPSPPEVALEPELRLQGPTVVSMARLVEQKGVSVLIRAFARLSDRFKEWRLVILGEGRLRRELESLIEDLGLRERVFLPGCVKGSYHVLRQADLFVLASQFEGFPNSLCEAMAIGLPVISTDPPSGPRHIIRPGLDGLLVPCNDVKSLSEAMERLMQSPQERERLGREALRIIERFGVEQILPVWERMLERCMAEPHPSVQPHRVGGS